MANKINPWLAKHDAELEADHLACMANQAEIDRIALLLVAHDDLQVGPGRAGKLLLDFMDAKDSVAKQLLAQTRGEKADTEFLVLRRDLTYQLKKIFGPHWEKYWELFPMLKRYW